EQTSRLANAYVYDSVRYPGKSFTFHVKENIGWKLKLNCAGCKNRVLKTDDGKVPVLYLVNDMFDRDPDQLNHICIQELNEPEYFPIVEEYDDSSNSKKKSCKRIYKYESKMYSGITFKFDVKEMLIDGRMRLDCCECREVKESRGGRLPVISLIEGKFDKDPDKLTHICLVDHLRNNLGMESFDAAPDTNQVESEDSDGDENEKDEANDV
ncbi:hypothetical protein FO519_010356, partial [Halicephalobus sp. NKZ332]